MPLLLVSLMAACGGGSGGGDDDPDAGLPCQGLFCRPDQFSRDGCVGTQAVGTVDPLGIWHLDVQLPDSGNFPGAMRIDDGDGGLTGLLFGGEVNEVTVYPEDLYVRRSWLNDEQTLRMHALDACAVLDDGSLHGHFVTCWGAECIEGPVRLVRLRPMDEPVAAGITVVSEFAGDPAWPTDAITVDVRHHEGLDYVARYGDGLRIVDVTDPAQPRDRGHAPVLLDYEIYNDVQVRETSGGSLYAIAASNRRGAVVIDVTDPDAPVEVTRFPMPSLEDEEPQVHTLFLDGTRAYLAHTGRSSLQIWEVADPTAPVFLGEWIHPDVGFAGGFVHDLYVDNGRAYLDYWNLGMVVLDTLADPANPTVVGVFDAYERRTSHSSWVTTAGGRKVAVHGDEDFGAHVRIIDVDDQGVAFLDVLAEYQTRAEVSVHNIMAVGELAFVTYYQDGLRILDLSDPTDPTEIAHYRTWDLASAAEPRYGRGFYEGAIGLDHDAASGLLHVVDTHRGLFLFRVNP